MYSKTGSNNPIINIDNNKEKSEIGIRYLKKKCIADSKIFNSTDHSHMQTKIITKKKGTPEKIFPTKNKNHSRNISTLNKCSIIKENSKKSTNESTRNDRFIDYIIPSNGPT